MNLQKSLTGLDEELRRNWGIKWTIENWDKKIESLDEKSRRNWEILYPSIDNENER